MRYRYFLTIVFCLIISVLFSIKFVEADGVDFSIAPIMPPTQIEGTSGWYNVKALPNTEQTLQLIINNASNKEITVAVVPAYAITTNSGLIDYTPQSNDLDSSLKYKFPKMTDGTKKVKIPANGKQLVSFDVKIPASVNNQMILGGFYIYEPTADPKKEKISKNAKQTVQIRNYYNYTIAAAFQVGKIPDPNLNLVSIGPGNYGGYVSFGAKLQNDKANYISSASVTAKVTKISSNKIVAQRKQDQMAIAPNSHFTYNMQVGRAQVAPGKYHLNLTAKGSGKTWKFSKDFEITSQQASKMNQQNLLLPKDNTWIYIVIGIVVLLFFIAIVVFFYFRGQNKARIRLQSNLDMAKKTNLTEEQSSGNKIPKRRKK